LCQTKYIFYFILILYFNTTGCPLPTGNQVDLKGPLMYDMYPDHSRPIGAQWMNV